MGDAAAKCSSGCGFVLTIICVTPLREASFTQCVYVVLSCVSRSKSPLGAFNVDKLHGKLQANCHNTDGLKIKTESALESTNDKSANSILQKHSEG